MMSVRVTVGSSAAASLAGLQSAAGRYQGLQQKLSTGRQISVPSDDPAGTVSALKLRGDMRRNDQYARNSSDAVGWLTAADTSYGQIVDLAQKARTLTVQGLNSGASTGESDKAIAQQISSLREAAIKLANTTYNGRPIFGGTTSGDVAFDPAGTYVGDPGVVNRAIGDKNTLQISQTGITVFGTDATDPGAPSGSTDKNLFALLDQLAQTLKGTAPSGTPDLSDQLGTLDGALNKLASSRAASGSALQRVISAQHTQQTDVVTLKTHLSEIEDIDLAEVAIQTNTAQVVYQAALQTTANIRQLSLLDYLR